MPSKNKKQKKVSVSKSVTRAKTSVSAASKVSTRHNDTEKKSGLMIYIYWVVIAVFVGTTCYMISRSEKKAANEQALTEEPLTSQNASDEYAESGRQKFISGDTVGALNDFTVAIERNPSAINYVYRGETLMAGNNYDAAIADFESAIKADNNSVIAYYDHALANIKLEKLDVAKTDLDLAVAARSNNEDQQGPTISLRNLYAKRAQVNLWLRNWSLAEGDYTSSIENNQGDLDYNDYAGRAEARTNQGNYEGAIADYTSSVTIISDKIQKTPDEDARESISRQAMGFFEKSGALRVKVGQMDLAMQDLEAAHTLAIALGDMENKDRLQILISSLSGR